MFREGNIELQKSYDRKKNYYTKETVEIEVIEALQKREYTLNTVNSYGENLLHISAANGCLDIIKEIFRKHDCCHIIDRKNKFGWTPLMLAIRNRHIKTVKYLLQKNANVNESTYLGMSVFGLAAAIKKDMFEIVYKACPSALLNSLNDDITPLCIAAMKNDKNLFFKLVELGFDISKSNEYTYIMMKQSIVPEIRNLTKYLNIENYWNDNSDNILIGNELNTKDYLNFSKLITRNNNIVPPLNVCDTQIVTFHTSASNTDVCNNNTINNTNKFLKPCTLNLTTNQQKSTQCSLISPTLACTFNEILPASPNIYFVQDKHTDEIKFTMTRNIDNKQLTLDEHKIPITCSKDKEKLIDLNIQSVEEDHNTTLGYVPEFSPMSSPNVPPNINDENVFGENTPTPPHYKTPPRGMILNSEEAKMYLLLKHYGLSQHITIFLEQEDLLESEL
ncbi:hypothetical protein WN48_08390 [Eufriesea mexicana]|nr:hypothetical protein WN48_08390 [Eufriesea mexicana]